jgi:hypothetical protein
MCARPRIRAKRLDLKGQFELAQENGTVWMGLLRAKVDFA